MDGVQFILGRAGTGKTRWCTEAICTALAADGDEPLILLVPEQATYQAERAILSTPGIRGFSRLRILSFNRLAFWLDGGASAGDISRTGKQMVVQKLLLESAQRLSLYGGRQQQRGLADKLARLFEELQQAECTPDQAHSMAGILAEGSDRIAAAKWADIALLYEQYLHFFADDGRFANPDNRLQQAARQVRHADFAQNATVWVDGFSGFSVQERDMLIELLKTARTAHIALCLDPLTIDPANTDSDRLDPLSLFAATETTYTDLLRIFKQLKFPCREPVILDEALRFAEAPALGYLERHLFDGVRDSVPPGRARIRLAACLNVRHEAQWVGRVIRKLVRDRQMRYRDIAVVVPDMNAYAHYIESAFAGYGIPFFLDRPRAMKNHPVSAMLAAALQAVETNFALADVLSYLKSGLAGLEAEAIDRLENYCRAFDVQHHEWVRQEPWNFADPKDTYDETTLDGLRRRAIAPLAAFKQALSEEAMTAATFTRALWRLLETLDAAQQLEAMAAGDATDQLYGHRQLFARLVDLLDELCAVFGDTMLPAGAWRAIVTDAVASLTIKLIPPTLDQVLVGSIERSRHPDIKAIFLVGATQKQFPVPLGQDYLLGEADYRYAADSAMELMDPYQSQLAGRQYLTYIALTRASKYLFISHPTLDEKGAGVVPWSGIEQLQTTFADVEPVYPHGLADDPADIHTSQELAQWLCAAMGKDRTAGSRQPTENRTDVIAAGIWDRMRTGGQPGLAALAGHVKTALDYDNTATLEKGLIDGLYAGQMTTSVTRLGTFAACPYRYFARYVLGLEKRTLLRFEPLDIGTFYHAVLEAMFRTLKADGADWADVPPAELAALCERTVAAVQAEDSHIANFVRRNAHHRYIIEAAGRTLADFVPTLGELARAGVFRQQAAELKFGPDEPVKLTVASDGSLLDNKTMGKIDTPSASPTPLSGAQKGATHKQGQSPAVTMRGQIDRLDTAEVDGQAVGVVFDFKRTGRSANFAGMLYGLDLQLPAYLLAVGQTATAAASSGAQIHEKEHKRCLTPLIPAGAFYLPVEVSVPSRELSQLGQTAVRLNKARGIFDGRFAASLDAQAASGWSRCFNFYTNKDGQPYSHYAISGALKPDDFAALLDFTVTKVCELAAALSGGTIAITPYRLGKLSPCAHCDYRALCRFDWQINEYTILESCDKIQALEKMKQAIGVIPSRE